MKKLLLFAFAAFALAACSDDEASKMAGESSKSDNERVSDEKCVLYRERDPNSPLILSCPRERDSHKTRAIELGFDNILGRSFRLDHFPFENMRNVGEPVVDLAKLEADYPLWVTKVNLRESVSSAFSYSTFERYEEKSSVTKKVSSGFQLNLGIFKIGNKRTYYNHFAKSLLENSNSVFGQLDIEIRDAFYKLAINSFRLSLIRKKYLQKDFLDDLYNIHPYEFLSFYGPFVMTNFITGGRASALFAGTTKTITTAEGREKTMDNQITASFSIIDNGKDSVSLGIGRGFTNGSSSTESFTELETTLVTLGGAYGLGAFTTPKSIDNMNIDLTSWANSLNNTNTHSLIDIQNESLVPISEFFIEANLKSQYEAYIAGKDLPSKNFIEPKLVCSRQLIHSAGGCYNRIILITRYNDAITIHCNSVPIYQGVIEDFDDLFSEVCNMYKIDAILVSDYIVPADFNSCINFADCIMSAKPTMEGTFMESSMKKYYDTNNEILYLLYNENEKKMGYRIYIGQGDYLLDTYGIRQWVDTLPDTVVSDQELLNYTLIAL